VLFLNFFEFRIRWETNIAGLSEAANPHFSISLDLNCAIEQNSRHYSIHMLGAGTFPLDKLKQLAYI